jgi:peroxiredoxin Q/BCP
MNVYLKNIVLIDMKNTPAPLFKLQNQDSAWVDTRDFLGKKNLVLMFYPKDLSLGCTIELCSFRDVFPDFDAEKAVLFGINSGSIESHRAFKEKERFPFDLLSDPGSVIEKQFDVTTILGLLKRRKTFVIDKNGIVQAEIEANIDMYEHAREALKIVSSLK